MNEVDYIRQQLAAERGHLREILAVVRGKTAGHTPAPVLRYLEWAGQRLGMQLAALRAAMPALPDSAAVAAPEPQAARLPGLLAAWSEPLEALAARTLRTPQWRAVAHLSADTILEERQLYAAARAAAGLP